MSLYKDFETDKKAEEAGVWIDYGPNDDDTIPAFRLARMGKANKKYVKTLEKLTKPYRRQMELGTMGEKLAQELNVSIFADSIVLDWRNVQDKDGNEIEFSRDAVKVLMNDLPDLYADLESHAQRAATFREKELEYDVKN